MVCVSTDGINNGDGHLETDVEKEEVKFKTDAFAEFSAELIFKEGVKTELLPKINGSACKDGLELELELLSGFIDFKLDGNLDAEEGGKDEEELLLEGNLKTVRERASAAVLRWPGKC